MKQKKLTLILTGMHFFLITEKSHSLTLAVGEDLITSNGHILVDGHINSGDSNIINTPSHSFALGSRNTFYEQTQGILLGYDNILSDGANATHASYSTLIVGLENFAISSNSIIGGKNNEVTESISNYDSSNSILVMGTSNNITDHANGLVIGTLNELATSNGADGHNSTIIGGYNSVISTLCWILGQQNTVDSIASFTAGWGLTNNIYTSMLMGTWNRIITGNSAQWNDSDPAFILGNGSSNANRSNAIVTLKNGQTTLTNKAWDPEDPLSPSTQTNMAGGNALIVEGHTILKGRVTLDNAQGDVPMGPYSD